jgi:hypothetical protein
VGGAVHRVVHGVGGVGSRCGAGWARHGMASSLAPCNEQGRAQAKVCFGPSG